MRYRDVRSGPNDPIQQVWGITAIDVERIGGAADEFGGLARSTAD